MKKAVLAWHVHHEVLCEVLTEPLEVRAKYIRKDKPKEEQSVRLRLLKVVRGPLPSGLRKIMAESAKLRAESAKLRDAGAKLWAEGDKLWAETILEVYGNIILEWKWRNGILDCELENGEVYRGDDKFEDVA